MWSTGLGKSYEVEDAQDGDKVAADGACLAQAASSYTASHLVVFMLGW